MQTSHTVTPQTGPAPLTISCAVTAPVDGWSYLWQWQDGPEQAGAIVKRVVEESTAVRLFVGDGTQRVELSPWVQIEIEPAEAEGP